jgi:hypothetical protein
VVILFVLQTRLYLKFVLLLYFSLVCVLIYIKVNLNIIDSGR